MMFHKSWFKTSELTDKITDVDSINRGVAWELEDIRRRICIVNKSAQANALRKLSNAQILENKMPVLLKLTDKQKEKTHIRLQLFIRGSTLYVTPCLYGMPS